MTVAMAGTAMAAQNEPSLETAGNDLYLLHGNPKDLISMHKDPENKVAGMVITVFTDWLRI
jgi:hypothetical protein